MSFFSRSILVPAILLALSRSSSAQPTSPPAPPPVWPVTSAPARFSIELGHPKILPRLVEARLFLPNPKWADMPIRVFNSAGVAVGSETIAGAPGDSSLLIFDSSSGVDQRYTAYVGSSWPALPLPDAKTGGVLLESRAGDGKVINNLPEMVQAWNQSTKVIGRIFLSQIFQGGNRFGPQTNILSHLQGWFDLPAAAHLQFALISVDASFVLIDDKEVVEWPGQHGPWGAPEGPPQGAMDLAAGPHVLDFYNAYVASPSGNPPLIFSLAVKGGAFPDWTTLFGDNALLRPLGIGNVDTYELAKDIPGAGASGSAPPLAIKWLNQEESVINTDLADIGLITMQLNCLGPDKTGLIWTFDDGATAQGQRVSHLFLRPGMRTVHLSWKKDNKEVATLDQTIGVHADWERPGRGPNLRPEDEADLMARDPALLSTLDLVGGYALAEFYLKPEILEKLAPALTAKMKDVSDADLTYVQEGATYLAREDWAHCGDEIGLLRAVIDRCGQGTPPPGLMDKARLALARLLLKTSDKLDEVKSLADAIDAAKPTGNEAHVLVILKADLMLAAGDVPGARKEYVRLTGDPSGPDVRSSIRRTARIGQARAFLDRQDFNAAEDAMNEVAWQAPIEKLSPDWALTRLRLYQEENLPGPALIWAKRLLPVLREGGRSDLLFRLTDLAYAQGDKDLAEKTLSELLQKHPYSEEAARAKQKWPGK